MKTWGKLLVLFLLVLLVLGSLFHVTYRHFKDEALKQRVAMLGSVYSSVFHADQVLADLFFKEVVNRDEILALVQRIVHSQGTEQRIARGLLYRFFSPVFKRSKENVAEIFHFHFPDNRSMLRLHLPHKADDDLSLIRPSIVLANSSMHAVHGFESGRMGHAYRHVYPLSFAGEHIGSVEISTPAFAIYRRLQQLGTSSQTKFVFFSEKGDLLGKIFKGQNKYYVHGELHPTFVRQRHIPQLVTDARQQDDVTPELADLLRLLKNDQDVQNSLPLQETFALHLSSKSEIHSVIFQAVKNVSGNGGGYLLTITPEHQLKALAQRFWAFYWGLALLLSIGFIGWGALQKALEQKKRGQKLMETINTSMGDGVYTVDRNGDITYANPAMERMLGFQTGELLGKNVHTLFHMKTPGEKCPLALDAGQASARCPEIWFKHLTGLLIPVSAVSTPIMEGGEHQGTITVVHNVSERKRMEEDLRQSEERFKKLSNLTFEGIMIHNKGVILDVNDSLTQMSGYAKEELLGKNLIELLFPTEYHDLIRQNILKRIAEPYDVVSRKKDGTLFPMEIESRDVSDKEGEYRVAALRDITARAQAEEKRVALEVQLRQKYKMEAIGLMAGGIAHNFNNTLAIILGNVELLQKEFPHVAGDEPYLANAMTAIFRARDLVKQIQIYSRQDEYTNGPVVLAAVVDETVKLLRPTFPTTINLEIKSSVEAQNCTINADSGRIQEALINLCTNAGHAMDEKGDLTIAVESVQVAAADIPAHRTCLPGDYACLTVVDTGCGMAPETVEKIFDPFFTTKAVGRGTGMGLSTVQGIVDQHDGFIKVQSCRGQGTTFELYFPTISAIAAVQGEVVVEKSLPQGSEQILFVDDDEMLVRLGEEILTRQGYTVRGETSSRKALEAVQANPDQFDILITDQTMPDLTGKELILEIFKIRPTLPTIICTGYSSKISEADVAGLGIDAFCKKPLQMADFLQTVRDVLDSKPQISS